VKSWRKATIAWCPMCEANMTFLPTHLGGLKCRRCSTRLPTASKFGNRPTKSITGRMHHSRAEASHASEVLAMEQAGLITDVRGLHRSDSQEEFALVVPSRLPVEALLDYVEMLCPDDAHAKRLCTDVRRSMVKIARYRADFSWTNDRGEKVVQDVKGVKTASYRMKRALMLAAHGIEIQEIDAHLYRKPKKVIKG
jgi:hypothetical protein